MVVDTGNYPLIYYPLTARKVDRKRLRWSRLPSGGYVGSYRLARWQRKNSERQETMKWKRKEINIFDDYADEEEEEARDSFRDSSE